MSTRVDTVNRTVLVLLGLLLVAPGALGLVAAAGGRGPDLGSAPVLPDALREVAADTWWFWPAVGAACLVVAALALRWLLAQLRTDHVGEMDLTDDPREGVTVLDGAAVATALTAEVAELPGVSGASARLRDRRGALVDLRVDLDARADVALVRERIESEVVPHLRQALDQPDLPVTVELRPGRSTRTRSLG